VSPSPVSAADPAAEVAELVDHLGRLLEGDARRKLLDTLLEAPTSESRRRRLKRLMSRHAVDGEKSRLPGLVRRLDARTREDGFRVLHSWDHKSHTFTADLVPVLLADYFEPAEVEDSDDRVTLGILLDYYFLHLLSLAAMRAWDAPDPDAHLTRVTEVLGALQGRAGSGHAFVRDAETLVIYALSQFHPEEQAYDRIIERVGRLSVSHQLTFARASAAVLSAHLRWGFWVMYERDVGRMRADNVGDYPWLLHTAHTLLRAYADGSSDGESRDAVCSALLLALAADPWVFRARCPGVLESYSELHAETRGLLETHGEAILADLERFRPGREGYAPLSLVFNFPHNALVAVVTLALMRSKPQPLSINALFEEECETGQGENSQEELARQLMAFSGASPDRLGYRSAKLIAYDPLSGMRSFSMTVDTLKKSLQHG
jgi:hypothetical protein